MAHEKNRKSLCAGYETRCANFLCQGFRKL